MSVARFIADQRAKYLCRMHLRAYCWVSACPGSTSGSPDPVTRMGCTPTAIGAAHNSSSGQDGVHQSQGAARVATAGR